jgi:pimeloyl-ACP methyl ester carboxylesterase
VARIWRTRGAGELLNAMTTRAAVRLALRQARSGFEPLPAALLGEIWAHYDRGMKRAVLRLYRSADPEKLEAGGAQLERLDCPALVVWGAHDPYIPMRFARAFAARLPNAELLELDRAGHWPWIDQPQLVGRVVDFLCRSRE